MPPKKKIRILLADDHPIVREGLRTILETQKDFKIVDVVAQGDKVVNRVEKSNPDILLLDIEMPEMDGVEIIKRLKKSDSTTKVIVFTAYNTDERIISAVKAGAKGYLLKGAPREEIFDAVRTVYRGGSSLQSDVVSKLMKQVSDDYGHMTPRELDVLHLLSKGLSNKEIAGKLFITERTVKFHISSILQKLNAESRTEAVTKAAHRGIISL